MRLASANARIVRPQPCGVLARFAHHSKSETGFEPAALLHKEEAILFPFIELFGRAELQNRPVPRAPFGSIANPNCEMERGHTGAGDARREIRRLTNDLILLLTRAAALYEGLKVLEADLHVHIRLENNILFPRAIALEKK